MRKKISDVQSLIGLSAWRPSSAHLRLWSRSSGKKSRAAKL